MKSISFLFIAILSGLFFIACKDAKSGAESTETAAVVITADSLQGLKASFSGSLTEMQTILATKIAEVEANIAATTNETAKQEFNTYLERLKKVNESMAEANTKVANATAETWETVYNEVLPVLHDTKSILTGGGASTTPHAGTTTGGEKK